MDKQFNLKDFLLLMVLTLIVLFISGCEGGTSTSSSARPTPNQDQGQATSRLERLTLTAFPVKTKGTSELTLITGNEQSFLALAEYSNGQSKVLNEELGLSDWQSSDKTVGDFVQSGVLQSKAAGAVTVSFTKDNLTSNSVEVIVADATITDIIVHPPVIDIAKGQSQVITATANYSNGLSMNISDSVTWTSDDPSTATITANKDHGLLTGNNIGTTTLTAFKNDIVSNTINVDVSDAVISAISVTPSVVGVAKGQKQTLNANAIYSDNTSSDVSDSVSWMPVDASTATVTSSGLLSGSNVGTTTLIAAKDNVTSNTIDVNVTDAFITEISVMPSIVKLAKGQSQTLRAIATYSDNTSSDISDSVTWVPVDTNTAAISAKGVLSGSNTGTTTLTAFKDDIVSNTVDVEVTNAVIAAISITPSVVSIAKGQNQTLTANAIYSDNTSSDVSDSVSWIPVDANTTTVSADGVLSGLQAGTTTLTAVKDGVISNTVGVLVSDAVITSITVAPPIVTIAKGQSQVLTANAIYSDNTTSNISRSVTWMPVDTSIVNISRGRMTGVGVGTTTVTAVKDGFTSNASAVEVTNAVITELTLTPPAVGLMPNGTQQMKATARYSDGTVNDVTRSVKWSAPGGNTMSFTASGLATGLNPGTSNITADYNGFRRSVEVNVCQIAEKRNPVGKCTYTLDVGNNRLFTNTPSVPYLDSLGIGGSRYTSGVHRPLYEDGSFYLFTQTKAVALCNKYSEFHLAGRTNWRLPTVTEIKDIYTRNLNIMSGWSTSYYWTSSIVYNSHEYFAYKYLPARPGHSWQPKDPNASYLASCISDP
ncbi:MAG: Ig-like domain-containing protein [Vibrio sp.]|uniref:Ig-like domain-containing protein n=1 Tax=Vibrio TaxID=662 RepID=UPI001EC7B47E|nr:Ig-like domain-containing protein [Vibrio sp.]NRB70178.1 Ig-like domain-containing protein [Vibrio sp.]